MGSTNIMDHLIWLTRLVAHNITALTCRFPDRDRGAVSSAVTFTSLAVALALVMTRAVVFWTSRVWGWDDIATGFATVRLLVDIREFSLTKVHRLS